MGHTVWLCVCVCTVHWCSSLPYWNFFYQFSFSRIWIRVFVFAWIRPKCVLHSFIFSKVHSKSFLAVSSRCVRRHLRNLLRIRTNDARQYLDSWIGKSIENRENIINNWYHSWQLVYTTFWAIRYTQISRAHSDVTVSQFCFCLKLKTQISSSNR